MRTRFRRGSRTRRVAECLGLVPMPVGLIARDTEMSEADVQDVLHKLRRQWGVPIYGGRDAGGAMCYHVDSAGLAYLAKLLENHHNTIQGIDSRA